jgi:NADPH:quinone reductase-like Zn-dependent oxidoreductase
MKAIRIHEDGGPEVLRYEDAPDPEPGPGEVLVRLRAASLNHIDLWVRKGLPSAPKPRILGADGAGIREDTGERVVINPGFERGDRILVLGEHMDGTHAELVAVPETNVFPIPEGLSFEEAAAFPLVYTTAWRLLMTQGKLIPGETVLIRGVGGGIAIAALQIAASVGARLIVSSANNEKLARAKALGSELTINDQKVDLPKEVRRVTAKHGVDLVVDCVGGADWGKSLACLARGGRLITCGAIAGANPRSDLRRIFWNHLKICGATHPSREEFRQVLKFFAYSGVKPIIDTVYALREAGQAQRLMEQRRQFGKIVLRTDN